MSIDQTINESIRESMQEIATHITDVLLEAIKEIRELPELLPQKEVLKLFKVTPKTLRIWEENGLPYYRSHEISSIRWYKTEEIYKHLTKIKY